MIEAYDSIPLTTRQLFHGTVFIIFSCFLRGRLRSPKAPDEEADMGSHEFSYAVLPHSGKSFVILHVVRDTSVIIIKEKL